MTRNVALKSIKEPLKDFSGEPVVLSDATIQERKEKVLRKMKEQNLDQLIIYSDVEHNGNFQYLVGYFPRFEEALLVMTKEGEVSAILGNENHNKGSKSRIQLNAVLGSVLSLPFQPDHSNQKFTDVLREANVTKRKRTGIVGWKIFTASHDANETFYDVPHFIVSSIREVVGEENEIVNSTHLFIGDDGVRTVNNANEIAHYEFGASLASDSMLDAMNEIEVGRSELEVADKLLRYGQHTNVVTICASGERFVNANMFPSSKKIELGDPMSLTVSYVGGLSSRAGYAVSSSDEMDVDKREYINDLVIPYYRTYTNWLETIKIGMLGGEMYDYIEEIFPKEKYNWNLCPGHLTSEEEWMTTPIYEGSSAKIRSGMIFQVDFIPSIKGYSGVSAESTIALADEELRSDIKKDYPELWKRIEVRRKYIIEVLGIQISEEVLPMCSTVGYLRPYLLNKEQAMVNI